MQGTDRDQQHLNIFLEFVPGGSIASLLTRFGVALLHCHCNHIHVHLQVLWHRSHDASTASDTHY